MARNPFKPTAGATPPLLVGRDEVLAEFNESLDDGPGAPARLALVNGARGVGKTVLLTTVAHAAETRGWVTLAETATPGLVDRLKSLTVQAMGRLDAAPAQRHRMAGFTLPSFVGVGGGGMTFSPSTEREIGLREHLGRVLDVLEPRQTGLLITIDEVHRAARIDLRDFITTYQHLVRDGRDIALTLAGLPSSISHLLNDDVLTFLRRATPFELGEVPIPAVRDAFSETIRTAGRAVTDDALDMLAGATEGYPFMIQLVGYHAWRKADNGIIDAAAAGLGIPAAQNRLGATVHATALADLSEVDRTFLIAMAQEDGPSRTSDIARRIGGVTVGYANVYRTRLLDAGMIRTTGYGQVDFALPYLREYLRDHGAHLAMTARGESAGKPEERLF